MTLPISTAEIVERFAKGESSESIAKHYGCHRQTIMYRLAQAGARNRTRAKVNARVMLTAHRPVLVGLLRQLEKTLEMARDQLVSAGRDPILRRKCLQRIEKLEEQIHALQAITTTVAKRVTCAKEE